MTSTAADTGARVDRLAGVTLVRAGAAVLVVHGYLVGLWLQQHGENPSWLAGIREWVNRPLRLGEDFGALGLMLLLLASGFLAGAAVDRPSPRGRPSSPETPPETPPKTHGAGSRPPQPTWLGPVWVYLPVPVATLLTAGALLAGARPWTSPPDVEPTVPDLLGNLTLLSHLVPGWALLVPLAWVTGAQLVCWLAAIAARRAVWPVALAAPAAAIVLAWPLGDETEHLALLLCLLPVGIVGLLAWKVASGALAPWVGVLLGSAGLAAVIAVERAQPALADWWYPVAACYALLLFLTAIMVAGPVAAAVAGHPASRWLADRAEWLMLLLGAVGHSVLGLLHHRVPLAVATAAAVLATAAVADVCHRLTSLLGPRWPR